MTTVTEKNPFTTKLAHEVKETDNLLTSCETLRAHRYRILMRKWRRSEHSSEVSGIYRSLSSDWLRSVRSTGHAGQIRQSAAQSQLRELRQRAPLTAKVHWTVCWPFAMLALCRWRPLKSPFFWPEACFPKWRPDIEPFFWPILKTTGIFRWAEFRWARRSTNPKHVCAHGHNKKGNLFRSFLVWNGVRWARLELAQDCSHYPLKVACLPFHHHRLFDVGLQRYDKKSYLQIFLQKFQHFFEIPFQTHVAFYNIKQ